MGKESKKELEILHEDEALVIIHKPPRLLSIPDRFKPDLPNAKSQLQQKYEHLFTVHRLDKDTSGIICFARTEEAHRHLSLQFEARQVKKTYLAFTEGAPAEDKGLIDYPIAVHPTKPGKMVVHPKGKPSQTAFRVMTRFRYHALLELDLLSGRTHQIRVHLSHAGFPLLVDPLYGKREAFYLSSIKGKKFSMAKNEEERPLITRLTLHAHRLELIHPQTEQNCIWEAELPKDLRALHRQLVKWSTT